MFQESYMRIIGALVGLAAVVALGAYTYYAVTQARYTSNMPVSISVTGKGEIFAPSDIATFSFSVNAKEVDVKTAQTKSADSVNKIVTFLKEKGIEDRDIKTSNYNISPQYEYKQVVCTQWSCPPVGDPKIVGYSVEQSIEVKVRKIDTVGDILSGVGGLGATNVSGLSFTIDDDETLKAEARDKAIADAQDKAQKLADKLGVHIVRMNGYWEDQVGFPMAYGMGGGVAEAMSADVKAVPQIPSGENKITTQVNISYEVR